MNYSYCFGGINKLSRMAVFDEATISNVVIGSPKMI